MPDCENGNLYRWAIQRFMSGALEQELKTCSFVCIRNSLNRLAEPKCPVGWCGQDAAVGATSTGDCQCCNGIEWTADTTDQTARDLICAGSTDPFGSPYPWQGTTGASAGTRTQTATKSVLKNGATCYNCT